MLGFTHHFSIFIECAEVLEDLGGEEIISAK